jgi:hypothetical protein
MAFYLPSIIKVINIEKSLNFVHVLSYIKYFKNNGVLLYNFTVEEQYYAQVIANWTS